MVMILVVAEEVLEVLVKQVKVILMEVMVELE
jgi:hypothetical protein